MKKLIALILVAILLLAIVAACSEYVPFVRDNPGQTTLRPGTSLPPGTIPTRDTTPPWEPPPLPDWPPLLPLEPIEHITPPPRPGTPPVLREVPQSHLQIMLDFLSRFPNLYREGWDCCSECCTGDVDFECYYDPVRGYSLFNIGDDIPAIVLWQVGPHWDPPRRLYRFVDGEYQLVYIRDKDDEYSYQWFPTWLQFHTNQDGRLIAFEWTNEMYASPPRAYYADFTSPTRVTFTSIPLGFDPEDYATRPLDAEIIRDLGIRPIRSPYNLSSLSQRLNAATREMHGLDELPYHPSDPYRIWIHAVCDTTLAEMIADGVIPLNVRELSIGSSIITNVDMLFWFENLERLTIDSIAITCLRGLVNMRNLTTLSISYGLLSRGDERSPLYDLRPLTYLENLVRLELRDNSIYDLRPLTYLTNLRNLALDRNSIEDLRPLTELTSLTQLSLFNNLIFDVRPLAGLVNLQWLNLSNDSWHDEGNENENRIYDISLLSELRNLESISLRGNQLQCVAVLHNFRQLTGIIDLLDNPISEYNIRALQNALPSARIWHEHARN